MGREILRDVLKGVLKKKTIIQQVALWTVLVWLIGHAYGLLNPLFSHDSLMIYQNDANWQISLGRFFEPIYLMLRGDLCAPWLVGVFSLLWLVFAISVIAILLDLKSKVGIALTCGILTVNTTTVCATATYLPWVDVYMLAFLLSVLGVFICRKFKNGWLLGSVFVCMAVGLYQSYLSVSTVLFMILLIKDILDGSTPSSVARGAVKALATLALGLIIYLVMLKLVLAVTGIAASDSYNGLAGVLDFSNVSIVSMLWNTWSYPFNHLLNPEIYASKVVAVFNIVVFVCCLGMMAKIVVSEKIPLSNRIMLVTLLVLMPLGVNTAYFASKGLVHSLMIYAFFFAYVLVIVVFERAARMNARHAESKLGIAGCLVMALLALIVASGVIHANQVYLKKGLEYQATQSTVTRVLDRIEQTDGYVAGETPVAFLGRFDRSPLLQGRKGFEDFRGIGLSASSSLTYPGTEKKYFDNVLGYPINVVSLNDAEVYSQLDKTADMPVFPSNGSVKMVDGTVIVKISES